MRLARPALPCAVDPYQDSCVTWPSESDPLKKEHPLASDDTIAPDFEQALAELENLVERLERGDLPLEEALKTFERGVALTRHCQASLKAAQQKVEILLKRGSQNEVEPFTVAEDEPTAQPALERVPGA